MKQLQGNCQKDRVIDKSCKNCKYEDKWRDEFPCYTCKWNNNKFKYENDCWEAKTK